MGRVHLLYFLPLLLLTSVSAQADWSANLGWASDYYFRGILQKSSSASGGIDFEHKGFYAGTWVADVDGQFGDGLEVDGYFGYGGSVGDFTYGVGFTGYYYTGDFDDTYQEINLSAGYGWLTIDAAVGEYENFAGPKLIFWSPTRNSENSLDARAQRRYRLPCDSFLA